MEVSILLEVHPREKKIQTTNIRNERWYIIQIPQDIPKIKEHQEQLYALKLKLDEIKPIP